MVPADGMIVLPEKWNGVVDLDTAISMAGLGKFHVGLMLVVGGCLASTTTDNLGNSFILSAVGCEWDLSVSQKGLFSGATFLGNILTAYGWGFASDTYGRRGVLVLSLGLGWLASICASLAPVFWLLVTFRFLAGAASAGMSTTVYAYLAEFLPPKQRAKYLSWCSMFNAAVYCLLPATAWLILPQSWSLNLGFVVLRSWRILSILNGSYILITFLGMIWLPESPKYLVSIEKHDKAIEVLKKVFSTNTGRDPNDYPVLAIRSTAEDIRTVEIVARSELSLLTILKTMKDQVVPIFGRKHIYTTILGCIYEFCIFSSACGFYLWMPEILSRMMSYYTTNPIATVTVCDAINIQLTETSNTTCHSEINPMVYVSALMTGANYCAGYLLVGFLVNVMGKRILLATLQFISGLAGFGLYWATDTISVGILATVFMVQSGLCITILSSVLLNLYPTHLRSAALCIVMSVGRLGSSMTGTIMGSLIQNDCSLTIFGLGLMSIGTGLLSFCIPRPAKMIEPVT